MNLSELFSVRGVISRSSYVSWGCGLFFLKYNLDRLVAAFIFKRSWHPIYYLVPERATGISNLEIADRQFYFVMLAFALPFIWVGTALTIRRLRSVGLSPLLTVLFFIPFVNFFLFLLLSLLPPKRDTQSEVQLTFLSRLVPHDGMGAAAVGLLVATFFGVVFTMLSVLFFKSYGWGVFVGIPFMAGFCSVLVYGFHEPREFGESISVSLLSVVLIGVLLIGLAIEGFMCVLMAAPIGLLLGFIGGIFAYSLQKNRIEPYRSVSAIIFSTPLLLATEANTGPKNIAEFSVVTSIEIAAPPQDVWKHVVSFSELPSPNEFIFKTGIAYPIRARIEGSGVGATRYCSFSTGDFVEPIEVWDEPRLLKFVVTKNPPPMNEWSPYSQIQPPHIDNFFNSHSGQFKLIPMSNGGTLLEGTTWYSHGLWPEYYWKFWSEELIHRIHYRVLQHVKQLSESESHL